MSIPPKATHPKGAAAQPVSAAGKEPQRPRHKATVPDTGLVGLHRESPYLTVPGSNDVFKGFRRKITVDTTNDGDGPVVPGLVLTNDDGRPIADPHTRDADRYREAKRVLQSLDHHDGSSELVERQANELSKLGPNTLAKQLAQTKKQYEILKERLAEAMTKPKFATREGDYFDALKRRRPEIARRIEHLAAELATKHSTDPVDPHSPRSMDIQIRRAFDSVASSMIEGGKF
jgi:hypothetical protein